MRRVAFLTFLVSLACQDGEIDINVSPIVENVSPTADWDDNGDQASSNVRISGTVYDDQLVMMLNCVLSSDRVGVLWEGNPTPDGRWEWFGELPPGEHQLQLEIEDSQGNATLDEWSMYVRQNSSPNCSLELPTPGAYRLDESVSFRVLGVDSDNDELRMLWSSDREGTLFEGSEWSQRLTETGRHIITVRVTDEFGATCADEVAIEMIR